MELLTKYITVDEFNDYTGENLDGNLVNGDNPSNKGNAFLYRIEKRLSSYLDANFYRNVDKEYPTFTNYQKEHYKLALLEQALYIFKNGDVSVDSGYEQESGVVADREKLKTLFIAPNCKTQLMLCGLWCTHINNHGDFNVWHY